MGARKLAYYVHVPDETGALQAFGPDDDVPEWATAKITNEGAWEGGGDDAAQADTGSSAGVEGGSEPEVKPYKDWLKADLEAEVAKRNEDREDDDLIEVDAPGNKAELIAALEGDDAAQAADDVD